MEFKVELYPDYANLIIDQLMTPMPHKDYLDTFSLGERNDSIVDFCIAARLLGSDAEKALDMLNEHIEAAVLSRRVSNKCNYGQNVNLEKAKCLEHFNRIWPYAVGWVDSGEWMYKLIGDYAFELIGNDDAKEE